MHLWKQFEEFPYTSIIIVAAIAAAVAAAIFNVAAVAVVSKG